MSAAEVSATRRGSVLRFALLWIAGADLRLPLLAVPPVLPLIHRDLLLSEAAVGALTGLPVLLLGLAAVPGSLSIARLGARRAAILGLVLVAAASAMRGVGPSVALLFLMTFVTGVGVAVLQPVLPSLVGAWFPARIGFATAVYANGLIVGEAAPAALTIPFLLPWLGGSWALSFAVWALPVAATAAAFAGFTGEAPATVSRAWWPDWRNADTWRLGLMQGGTGGLYFSANAFIPDYLHATGRPGLVAICLSVLNLGQLPASAVLLVLAQRLAAGRAAYVVLPLCGLASVALFVLAPIPALIVLGAGGIGFSTSFVLILTLALPPQLVSQNEVHRLSAGMFTIGYVLSCLVPPLGGVLWDLTHVPAAAFVAGALSALLILGAALSLEPVAPGRARR
jgi:MFS transporter, CP family, cyanate transporter